MIVSGKCEGKMKFRDLNKGDAFCNIDNTEVLLMKISECEVGSNSKNCVNLITGDLMYYIENAYIFKVDCETIVSGIY